MFLSGTSAPAAETFLCIVCGVHQTFRCSINLLTKSVILLLRPQTVCSTPRRRLVSAGSQFTGLWFVCRGWRRTRHFPPPTRSSESRVNLREVMDVREVTEGTWRWRQSPGLQRRRCPIGQGLNLSMNSLCHVCSSLVRSAAAGLP